MLPDAKISAIVETTLESSSPKATNWSNLTLAKELGISRMRHFKLSRDKRFEEQLGDVVRLYLNPLEHAIVMSIDEKTQIQVLPALNWTQTILPMRPGMSESQIHDYRRNATTDLLSALNVVWGRVIDECHSMHRAREFVAFLMTVDCDTAHGLDIHNVLDNLSTHRTSAMNRWLLCHQRLRFHFVPTGSSWPTNQLER